MSVFIMVLLGLLLMTAFGMVDSMAKKAERDCRSIEQQVTVTQPYVNLQVVIVAAVMVWVWGLFHLVF